MPTWGIVLLIIGYLGIGMVVNWWACDYRRDRMQEYWAMIIIWPLVVIPPAVLWVIERVYRAAKWMRARCRRENT